MEITCIPHHFFYFISEKHCTISKPLSWPFQFIKNILFQFIEGQIHFSNACGAKMSLTLSESV